METTGTIGHPNLADFTLVELLISFESKRGAMVQAPPAAASLVEITSALGSKLGLEVNPLSHMRICTPNSVGGYPPCP